MKPPVHWRDHLFGCALACGYVATLLLTANDLAMSRDESFYAIAAESLAPWFERLVKDPKAALEPSSIDGAWGYNHEHPPLMKSLFALSWRAQLAWKIFPTDSMAIRFPGMVSAGLILWLTYVFGARVFGRAVGAFAALAFALLPRPFYHAHLACFDIPITFFVLLVTYCYWRSLTQPRWALLSGVTFGLALATKHNSWLLPGIFLIHWLWARLVSRRRKDRVSLSILWLPSMIILGPLILFGLWPWLWHDTQARVREYIDFHVHHVYYNMAYFNRNYFEPPFPSSFPFVMTLFTVPATSLLLAVAAIALRGRQVIRSLSRGNAEPSDPAATDVLLFGSALAPIAVIAIPSTPIFGGTKHWFPAYPFLMMFAGYGFVRVLAALRSCLKSPSPFTRFAAQPVVGAVLLCPNLVETVHSHPFGLSHYGVLAGGVPGAANLGMNRQFWGFTTGSIVDWLRRKMPYGGTVWICDTTEKAWEMLVRDGRLPANIRATHDLATADFVLVHHEHHFAEVDFQAWVAFGSVKPAHVLTYDGVPIITIYENPRRRKP